MKSRRSGDANGSQMTRSVTPDPRSPDRRILTGLLGAPIAHSASPAMHERAAEALGLRCHYQLIEIAGAGREQLKVLLEGVRRLGFAGINVTFPYKEAVVELLDELSPGAARIGAVNTVVVRDNRLIGHNTDTTGFARAVSPLVTASAHGAVALIGAGGVGKAIAFALAGLGVTELRIFDSEPCQGRPAGRSARRPRQGNRHAQRRGCAARRGRRGQRLAGRDAAQPRHAGAGRPAACRTVGRRCGLFAALDAAADGGQGQGLPRS